MRLRYLGMLVVVAFILVASLFVYAAWDAEPLPKPSRSSSFLGAAASKKHGTIVAKSSQMPSYDHLHYEIDLLLCSGECDLVPWATELLDKEPEDATAALIKIDILLRVGLDHHAAKTVVRLKSFYDQLIAAASAEENRDDDRVRETKRRVQETICQLYETAKAYSAWETALAVVDAFPEGAGTVGYRLRELMDHLRKNGWDDERMLRWLTEKHRYVSEMFQASHDTTFYSFYNQNKKAFPNAPRIPLHQDRPEMFWLKLKACQLQRLGREGELLASMEQDAREHPTDTTKMLDYLNVLRSLCHCETLAILGGKMNFKPICKKRKELDLAWVADVFQPQCSTAAYAVAQRLSQLQQWTAAEKFFRHALATPLKENEPLAVLGMLQCMTTPEMEKWRYRNQIQQGLFRCLTSLGDPLGALAVKAAMLRRPAEKKEQESPGQGHVSDPTPKQMSFEALERRTIESMRFPSDHPVYWERLASFYRRHKYFAKAEHAYQKGLELAKSEPPLQGKAPPRTRTLLITGYEELLRREDRKEEALELLLKELRTATGSSESAISAMYLLVRSCRGRLCSNEMADAFWKWLEDHPYWGHLENQVLGCLEKWGSGKPPEVERQIMQRIEKLAKDADPSRAYHYGNLLLRRSIGADDRARAIPWFRYVAEYKVPKDSPDYYMQLQRDAKETLFHHYAAEGDVSNAERLHRDCMAFLSVEAWRRQLEYLAVSAAVKGNHKLAMRCWRQSASISLCDQPQYQLTGKLRHLGLDDEIDAYYREVKEKIPEFTLPIE